MMISFQFCFRTSSRLCGSQNYQKLSLRLSLRDAFHSQSALLTYSKSQVLEPIEDVSCPACCKLPCALQCPHSPLHDEIQFIHSLTCRRHLVVVSLLVSFHLLFTFCVQCHGWSELACDTLMVAFLPLVVGWIAWHYYVYCQVKAARSHGLKILAALIRAIILFLSLLARGSMLTFWFCRYSVTRIQRLASGIRTIYKACSCTV
jgi:hypothetical protein